MLPRFSNVFVEIMNNNNNINLQNINQRHDNINNNNNNNYNNNDNNIINNNVINNINNNNNNNILPNNQNILNELSERTNNKLIVIFSPNKGMCFIIFLLNIIISGSGTFIIFIKNCSLYDLALGLIQSFGSYFLLLEGLSMKKFHYIYDVKINSFLSLYLVILSAVFYLSSIYVGIFHNFVYYNTRKTTMTESKEKGICIIILNLLTGGLGTVLYGVLKKDLNYFGIIKIWIAGIIQIIGFIIFVLAFTFIGTINKMILIIFFCIGILGYITSILIGIKCYKNISNS